MRVLVVSNHLLVGQSLVTTLRGGGQGGAIEAELCDAQQAVDVATATAPDVIVVEAVVDFESGLTVVRLLSEALPQARVVVLGTDDDDASVFEAVHAGADGFLARGASLDTLPRTLAGVIHGELGLPRAAALRVVRQLRHAARQQRAQPAVDPHGVLTQREREVYDLVRQGLRSREISERLCIADATAYKHIQNILDKLHVHSRAQAVLAGQVDAPTHPELAARASHHAPANGGNGGNGGDGGGAELRGARRGATGRTR